MSRGAAAPTLALLIPLGIANHTILGGSRVVASLDALSLGASPFTVGVLMALFALLPMFSAVAVGRLSDRIGVRRPMLVGSVGLGIGAALPFVWRGLPALFVSRDASSACRSWCSSSPRSAPPATSAARRTARATSACWRSATRFPGSSARWPPVSRSIISGIARRLRRCWRPCRCSRSACSPGAGSRCPGAQSRRGAAHHGGVRTLLRNRTLRNVLAINTLLSSGWDLHMVFVPIYGARIGLSASEIGMVLAVFASATIVIRMLTAADHAPPDRAAGADVGARSSAARRTACFPYAQGAATLAALSFVLGLGLGSGQPMVMSLLHTHAPAERIGEAVGVRMSLIQGASVFVPLLFGALGSSLGLAPVFWSMGACLVYGGVLARRRERG